MSNIQLEYICFRCGRQIITAWKKVKENYFHAHCFNCAICDTLIKPDHQLENSNLKEIYCDKCFQEYFGQTDLKNTPKKQGETSPTTNQSPTPESSSTDHSEEKHCLEGIEIKDSDFKPEESRGKRSQVFDITRTENTLPECSEFSQISQYFISKIPIWKTKVKDDSSDIFSESNNNISKKKITSTKSQAPLGRLKSSRASSPSIRSNIKISNSSTSQGQKDKSPLKSVHEDKSNCNRSRPSSIPRSKIQSYSSPVLTNKRFVNPPPEVKRNFVMPHFAVQRYNKPSNLSSLSHMTKPNTPSFNQNAIRKYLFPQEIINGSKVINGKIINSQKNASSSPADHGAALKFVEEVRNSKGRNMNDEIGNGTQDPPGTMGCPICFDPLITPQSKTGESFENLVTGCGHIFHKDCILSWLDKGNSRCPICSKLCLRDSLIPVFLEANICENASIKSSENEGYLKSILETLQSDFKQLGEKYEALVKEHSDCGTRIAINESLKSAYEMECRTRGGLQWENKRLHQKLQEMRVLIGAMQRDSFDSESSFNNNSNSKLHQKRKYKTNLEE